MSPVQEAERKQPWRALATGKDVARCGGFAHDTGSQISGFEKGDLVIVGGQSGVTKTVKYDTDAPQIEH